MARLVFRSIKSIKASGIIEVLLSSKEMSFQLTWMTIGNKVKGSDESNMWYLFSNSASSYHNMELLFSLSVLAHALVLLQKFAYVHKPSGLYSDFNTNV